MREDQILLWCDFETDGLDKETCNLLEVAVIFTSQSLVELARLQVVVKPESVTWTQYSMHPKAFEMHEANGLLDEVHQSQNSIRDAESMVTELCRRFSTRAEKRFIMAGSGVGVFDRPLWDRFFPLAAGFLDYPVIDIGVLRRTLKMFGLEQEFTVPDNTTRPHRALYDLEMYIQEMVGYRGVLVDAFDARNYSHDR